MKNRSYDLLAFTCVPPVALAAAIAGCADAKREAFMVDEAHWNFDGDALDGCPAGWRIAATKPTAAMATWVVASDPEAPSPPQTLALARSDNYDGTFNLAVAEGPIFRDLELNVKVKAVTGQEDQGGGPVWRFQDEDNYYVCRLNPLEQNFRVYVVAGGTRRQLDSATVALSANRWYDVRVRMLGRRITCSLDGKDLLEAADDTISRPGNVGLWTKADAATSFDDLSVRALGGP